MLDWARLCAERNAWVAYNFPGEDGASWETIWGCVEEVGELAHAHLKERQAIRGKAEEHQANAKDAVGDLIVYLMGCMRYAAMLPDPEDIPPEFKQPGDADEALLLLGNAAGKLCMAEMYTRWAPRHGLDPERITHNYRRGINLTVYLAERYCHFRGWDFEQIVIGTWNAVKERDWILYPDTGRPPERGDTGYVEPDPGLSPVEKAAQSDGHPGNAITPPRGADLAEPGAEY